MNGEGVVTAPPVNKDAVMYRADEPGATAEAQHRLPPRDLPRPGARVDGHKAAWVPCM